MMFFVSFIGFLFAPKIIFAAAQKTAGRFKGVQAALGLRAAAK